MSSSDPVEKILDFAYALRNESVKLVNRAIDTVQDTGAFKVLEQYADKGKNMGIHAIRPTPPPPPGLVERATLWVRGHKVATALIVAGVAGGTFYFVQTKHKRKTKKRRAARAPNGGRKEVVVLAGSPVEPLTRVIAADLNKRGFIVYWTTSSQEEEDVVAREGSADVRKLPIRTSEASSIAESVRHLTEVLSAPVSAFAGASAHELSLAGVVVVPDLYYPTGPVESLGADVWSDLVYSKILGPVFLLSNGLLDLVRTHRSRVLLLSPSIMSAIRPAFHAPESIAASALDTLALCMHRELRRQEIPLVHLKLGSFDVSHGKASDRQIVNSIRADILAWPDRLRALYAGQYQASAYLQAARTRGSPLRCLNYAVFDALTEPHPKRVWYVGRGAYAYQFLSSVLPESFMTWLLQAPSNASNLVEERSWEAV